MNVLFIRSNPVNPDSRVEKEVVALSKAGHNITILAWDRASNHSLVKTLELFGTYQIAVYRIGIESVYGAGFKRNLVPLAKFQNVIRHFLWNHSKEFDVIHACDFDTAFTAFFSKKHNCKFVYDVFDYYVDSFSVPGILRNVIERIDTYIMNHANAVIVCSEERINQLRYAHPQKLVVIHNTPMKLEQIDCSIENSDHKVVKIAYVGILSNDRDIIEICKFVSENREFELHIGGFGILEPLVKAYADKNNIHFYGRLSYADTLKLEQQCDILIACYDPNIPNHKYAAPNKFYEALMLGKPLIMAEGTGMSEVVRKNDIGSVVPYDCVEKGFLELLKKRSLWSEMGVREKKLYDQFYSWDTMEKRLIALYDDME